MDVDVKKFHDGVAVYSMVERDIMMLLIGKIEGCVDGVVQNEEAKDQIMFYCDKLFEIVSGGARGEDEE